MRNTKIKIKEEKYIKDSINCDASFLYKKKVMEWQIKDTLTGEILSNTVMEGGTSNMAEFFGVVDAMNYLEANGANVPIYSDSNIAIGWCWKRKCGTWSDSLTDENKQLIKEYEQLLEQYDNKYKVLKWKTYLWGEIPSDFNRK